MQTLEQRLTRLERSNRRWKYGAALLALAFAGIAAAGPDTTRHLRVVNEKNVVVAEIGASEGGDGQLKLFDRVHKQTVGISAGVRVGEHSDQAVVTINGMLMVRDGSAFTSLSGSDMQICKEPSDSELAHLRDNGLALRRVHLGIFDDYSGGFVQVLNPPGKIVAEMQCSKANAGFIAANDFDGDVKQSLSGAR